MKRILILLVCLGTVTAQSSLTLGSLASSRGLHFGAAVTFPSSPAAYDSVLAHAFNTVVCENAMKFGSIEPTRNNFSWTAADAIFNFAQAHGMYVRGHNFIWYQQAGYLANLPTTTPRDTFLAIIKNHINTVAGRYKGKIYEWDVVNEAIDPAQTDGNRRSFLYTLNGNSASYIDSAFVYAHRADSNALLVYNDYSAEGSGTKSNFVYALVSRLVTNGIPINGVGFQCHLTTWDTAAIGANMTRLEALGLNISITEMVDPTGDSTQQKKDYQSMMTLCLRHPRCRTFMTWGLNDNQSWLGAGKTPLLFTGTTTITAKPAYYAIVSAVSSATGIQTFGIDATRPGMLVPERSMKNGIMLFNGRNSVFDARGRALYALPLPR